MTEEETNSEYADDAAPGAPNEEPPADEEKHTEKQAAESPPRRADGSDKAQIALSAFLIVLLGAATYANSLGAAFVFGDFPAIVDNPPVHSVATVSRAWGDGNLDPLTAITFAINWSPDADGAFAFRLFNMTLHLFNAVLVFLLARRVFRRRQPESLGMAAGMLFVAHPALTQSVDYLAQRSALLSTFFILLTVVLYLRGTEPRRRIDAASLALSLCAYALAWACSPAAWIVLVLLPAADYARRADRTFANHGVYAPYAFIAVVAAVAAGVSRGAGVSPASLLHQAGRLGHYILPTVYPVALSVEHAPTTTTLLPVLWIAGLIVAFAALRFAPALGFALLWYLAAVAAPALFAPDAAFREDRLYLPIAGGAVLVAWLLGAVPKSPIRNALGAGLAALVIAFAAMTFMRNQIWSNELGLITEAQEYCPECFGPAERLAEIYVDLGRDRLDDWQFYNSHGDENEADLQMNVALTRFEAAESLLQFAAAQDAATSRTWSTLGIARRNLEKTDEAFSAFRRAIQLDPFNTLALVNLATLYETEAAEDKPARNVRRALDYYSLAVSTGDVTDDIRIRYATLLLNIGDFAACREMLSLVKDTTTFSAEIEGMRTITDDVLLAVQTLQNEMELRARTAPGDPVIAKKLAQQLYLQGYFLRSAYLVESLARNGVSDFELWALLGLNKAKIGAFQLFLVEHADPPSSGVEETSWLVLARRLAGADQWEQAEQALRFNPPEPGDPSSASMALGTLAEELGDAERAVEHYRAAAEEDTANPAPILGLFDIYAASNRLTEAEQMLEEAQRRDADPAEIEARRQDIGLGSPGESRGVNRTIR